MKKNTDVQSIINEATKLTMAQEYFERLGEIIQQITGADYTFITKTEGNTHAMPLVSIKHGVRIADIEYNLMGTPCLEVTKTGVGYYPTGVQALFPKDNYLKTLNIAGYLGATITTYGNSASFAIITCLYEAGNKCSKEQLDQIVSITKMIQSRAEREYLLRENYQLKEAAEAQQKQISYNETVIKEIHHRVKNNLQIISSLLRLQTEKIVDQKIVDLVSVCLDRIQSIALVHELLYNSSEFKLINIQTYVEKIVSYLFGRAAMDDPEVKIDVDEDLMELNSVIPCGLMLCEMVTNFKKYVKIEKPVLTISYKNNGTSRVLLVRDNGDGFSKSDLENLEQNSGMGLELIQLLADQIDAKCKFYNDNGACVEITF